MNFLGKNCWNPWSEIEKTKPTIFTNFNIPEDPALLTWAASLLSKRMLYRKEEDEFRNYEETIELVIGWLPVAPRLLEASHEESKSEDALVKSCEVTVA